ALCGYALDGTAAALHAALEELRIVDAKHRLAYTLTRAALIDLDRRRLDAAVARAAEALEYAEALGRPTEIMLAHFALAKAYGAANAAAAAARRAAAFLAFSTAPVAAWARAR